MEPDRSATGRPAKVWDRAAADNVAAEAAETAVEAVAWDAVRVRAAAESKVG